MTVNSSGNTVELGLCISYLRAEATSPLQKWVRCTLSKIYTYYGQPCFYSPQKIYICRRSMENCSSVEDRRYILVLSAYFLTVQAYLKNKFQYKLLNYVPIWHSLIWLGEGQCCGSESGRIRNFRPDPRNRNKIFGSVFEFGYETRSGAKCVKKSLILRIIWVVSVNYF